MNRISQYLVYPIVRFFNIFFFDVEFKNPDGFKPIIGKPAIIIANHISFYDSFLLRLNSDWTSLNVHFMGVTKFNAIPMRILWYIGVVPLVYFLFGVFIVVPGRGLEKNLEAPRNILLKSKSKAQVFIFPEGSVNRTGTLKPFKLGSATLASMTGVPILPISFKEIYESGKRKKILITLGEVVSFAQETNPAEINGQLEGKVRQMLS